MKYTLSTSEAADMLRKDDGAKWSYEAARVLVEWHEEQEDLEGKEIELDVVAIRCEWSEWVCASEAAESWGYVPDEGAEEEEAREWLEKKTIVLEAGHGIVVMDF